MMAQQRPSSTGSCGLVSGNAAGGFAANSSASHAVPATIAGGRVMRVSSSSSFGGGGGISVLQVQQQPVMVAARVQPGCTVPATSYCSSSASSGQQHVQQSVQGAVYGAAPAQSPASQLPTPPRQLVLIHHQQQQQRLAQPQQLTHGAGLPVRLVVVPQQQQQQQYIPSAAAAAASGVPAGTMSTDTNLSALCEQLAAAQLSGEVGAETVVPLSSSAFSQQPGPAAAPAGGQQSTTGLLSLQQQLHLVRQVHHQQQQQLLQSHQQLRLVQQMQMQEQERRQQEQQQQQLAQHMAYSSSSGSGGGGAAASGGGSSLSIPLRLPSQLAATSSTDAGATSAVQLLRVGSLTCPLPYKQLGSSPAQVGGWWVASTPGAQGAHTATASHSAGGGSSAVLAPAQGTVGVGSGGVGTSSCSSASLMLSQSSAGPPSSTGHTQALSLVTTTGLQVYGSFPGAAGVLGGDGSSSGAVSPANVLAPSNSPAAATSMMMPQHGGCDALVGSSSSLSPQHSVQLGTSLANQLPGSAPTLTISHNRNSPGAFQQPWPPQGSGPMQQQQQQPAAAGDTDAAAAAAAAATEARALLAQERLEQLALLEQLQQQLTQDIVELLPLL